MSPAEETAELLRQFGLESSGDLVSHSPIDGAPIGRVKVGDPAQAAEQAQRAFLEWRIVPAPRRGELVRLLGEELRAAKEPLARLVTLECGKIVQEAIGEVQEMIDICDFAVGLSRQLYGLTIASERPEQGGEVGQGFVQLRRQVVAMVRAMADDRGGAGNIQLWRSGRRPT